MIDFFSQNLQWLIFIMNIIACILLVIFILKERVFLNPKKENSKILYYFTAFYSLLILFFGILNILSIYELNIFVLCTYFMVFILFDILYLKNDDNDITIKKKLFRKKNFFSKKL